MVIARVTESQGKVNGQEPFKNQATIHTELKVLSFLSEELGKKARQLEASMGSKNYNEWVSLYKEVNGTLLAIEKAIYKRKLVMANKNLRSVREAIFSLFDKYDSLSKAMSEVDQRFTPRLSSNGGALAEVKTPPVDDIRKELEKARERIKKLLGPTNTEGPEDR
ncbi:MAG: hypothetical protein QXF26_06375 [Candidatus Bathyarchaeia archaeon]